MRIVILLNLLLLLATRAAFASTYIVTTDASSGPGSFRAGIDLANNHAGRDSLYFDLPGTGSHVLNLDLDLLGAIFIEEELLIDGYSQPGSTPSSPSITLQGSNGGFSIFIDASHVEITGLAFNFDGAYAFILRPEFLGSNPGHIAIHDNIFENCIALTLWGGSTDFSNLEIVNNTFYGSGSMFDCRYAGVGNAVTHWDSITVAGNRRFAGLENFTGAKVVIGGSGTASCSLTNFVFAGNDINAYSSLDLVTGLYVRLDGSEHSQVHLGQISAKHNMLSGGGNNSGISFFMFPQDSSTTEGHDIQLDSNVVQNMVAGIAISNGLTANLSSSWSDISVSGNTIAQCSEYGIGLREEGNQGHAITRDVVIADNDIRGGARHGLLLECEGMEGGIFGGHNQFQDIRVTRNHLYDNGLSGIEVVNFDDAFQALLPAVDGVEFSQNAIHHNGQHGIRVGGIFADPFTEYCVLPVPICTEVVGSMAAFTAKGSLQGAANTAYRLEFFTSYDSLHGSSRQGETYFGSDTITLDSNGFGTFQYPMHNIDLATHYVTLTATNLATLNTGCFSNAKYFYPATQMPDPRSGGSLSVYPNPATDRWVDVKFDGSLKSMHLSDSQGQVHAAVAVSHLDQGLRLDLGDLPAGIYFLQLQTSKRQFAQKIVVVH